MIDPKDDPRKLIVDAISTRIFAAKRFAIDEIMGACGKYDYHQSGLYILYDDIDTILYVGQIQHEKDSSLRNEYKNITGWTIGLIRSVLCDFDHSRIFVRVN